MSNAQGIETRTSGGRTVYLARVYDPRTRKRVSRTFSRESAAKKWRSTMVERAHKGISLAGTPQTLQEAADAFLEGIESGAVRTRQGTPYRPSTARKHRYSLERFVLDDLGPVKLARLERRDLQALIGHMHADGRSSTVIRNALKPVQTILRHLVDDGELAVNPAERLRLPALGERVDRIADPKQAAELLARLGDSERAIYATAFYAGLRLGELRGLDWSCIDDQGGLIRVERTMDDKGELGPPKTKAGRRGVPIVRQLRDELALHKLATGRDHGLVFGTTARSPFTPSNTARKAKAKWNPRPPKRGWIDGYTPPAPLEPIGLHLCRHTYASLLIAAGVNAKAISTYMGHSSISVTYDLYGHLMPGNEAETRDLLEGYLDRAVAG